MSYLEVKDLVKNYGTLKAVKGISFKVEKQAFFAFLGPNGAGKSTTINMISTLLEKDGGSISINGYQIGKDDTAIRKEIGIVFQTSMLDDLLSVKENLEIRGRFYEMSKARLKNQIEKLTKELSMEDFVHQKYGKLSGGQRRRADIARALINEPSLLILDEPTTGLDPKTREEVWAYIEELRSRQMTIFLTTHYMEEAAKASHVTIINQGEIVAEGTPTELKRKYSFDRVRFSGKKTKIKAILNDLKIPFQVKEDVIEIKQSSLDSIDLLNKLENDLTSFEVIQGSMDDVFITLTGKELSS
jgi:multidrug/hemolysin transport system ATP-binding protein